MSTGADDIRASSQNSVLCWLATANRKGEPNVSPKEGFLMDSGGNLLIANIASPISVRNIDENPFVCVSFVDVFRQKGFKVKGMARNIRSESPEFESKSELLRELIGDRYPIRSIIEVEVRASAPIVAPSYRLFDDVTEETQIAAAMRAYNVRPR